MLTIGIESSCDETAAAVVKDGRQVLSSVIASQVEIHKIYGGVVPEIASRKHMELISQVTDKALVDGGVTLKDIDLVAVSYGPGLVGALLVGLSFAKAMAFAAGLPLVGVNHLNGHLGANFLNNSIEPPFLCLIASGGHTQLVDVTGYTEFTILGQTRDDAAGEAFDKVARALGLPYPGGPNLERLAAGGNPEAVKFPRAKLSADSFDFSFSGLKSAVLAYLNRESMMGHEVNLADTAASFQWAVVDILTEKTIRAALTLGRSNIALGGGVACNGLLRRTMEKLCVENGLRLSLPTKELCTDNAAMIAAYGYQSFKAGRQDGLDLNAVARM